MSSITTKQGPNDDPLLVVNNILMKMGYHKLLIQLRNGGFSNVSKSQKLALAEIARVAATHSDPRIRDHLTKAVNKVHAGFFEYCFTLHSEESE